jgi:RNA polymerase sigma-70 factor (ECF subfamily)
MRRVADDDADAFASLYDRHAARAYRVARTVCHRPGAAEDAVEQAFISMWKGRSSYRSAPEGFAAWAMAVVRDRAVDVARRDAVQDRQRGGKAAALARPTTNGTGAGDEAGHLRGLLAALPDEQSEVIALAFFGELSHTEIAAHLGLPSGTVKGRMRLGLQKLSRSLT